MTKYIITLVLIIVSFQTYSQKYFYYGLSAGSVFSRYIGSVADDLESSFAPGFCAGTFFWVAPSQHLGARVDILYSQKSCKLDLYNLIYDTDLKVRLNYITVPVLFQLKFGRKTSFFFNIGGYYSYLTGNCFSVANIEDEMFCDINANNLNKSDYGIVTSAGIAFRRILVETRYEHGLCELIKNTDFSHQTFSIILGIIIP